MVDADIPNAFFSAGGSCHDGDACGLSFSLAPKVSRRQTSNAFNPWGSVQGDSG